MPFTVSKMGWIFGSIVFLLAGMVIQFGSVLLLKAKNLSRHSNYSTILYEIWRTKAAKGIASIIIFLNNLGICTIDVS
jgi:amino acid permease